MTLILPDQYSQVNMIFTGAPVPNGAQMTFAVHNPTEESPATIAAAVSASWVTNLKSFFDSNSSLSTIRVKNGPTATGPAADAAGPGAGSAANTCVAPNTAILIRKLTGFGGHAATGRMYMPCVDEAWIDEGGDVGGATLAALQTAYSDFKDDIETSGFDWVLLHSSTDPFLTPTFVLSLAVQSKAATQRRRLRH